MSERKYRETQRAVYDLAVTALDNIDMRQLAGKELSDVDHEALELALRFIATSLKESQDAIVKEMQMAEQELRILDMEEDLRDEEHAYVSAHNGNVRHFE